jgi:IS30 family transposase
MIKHQLTIKELVESHIVSKENCWITDYKPNPSGKLVICRKGKTFNLYRLVYESYKQETLSKDLFVHHTCENLLCINPDHLYASKASKKEYSDKRKRPRLNKLQIKERIESHIVSKNGCWLTDVKIDVNGRPRLSFNNKSLIFARVVYEVYKGDFPKNLFICHTCDNPLCVNPDHLYVGTSTDNGRNKKRRNRQAKGSKIGMSKLTEDQVTKIKELLLEGQLSFRQIAEMFGVTSGTIGVINKGKSWNHVNVSNSTIVSDRSKKNFKLDEEKVRRIKELINEGMSSTQISKQFGVSGSAISEIKNNKSWTHVKGVEGKISSRNVYAKKLSEKDVRLIKDLIKEGISLTEISEQFDVSVKTIFDIKTNKTWTEIGID